MTDTQNDCRRAFEEWWMKPSSELAGHKATALNAWQAAWSTRPKPNVKELVREIKAKRDFICRDDHNQWQNGYHRGNTDAIALIRKWAKGQL